MTAPARLAVLVFVACRSSAPPSRTAASAAPLPVAPIVSGENVDLEDDVAVVLTSRDEQCTWLLFDARSRQARRFLETPGICPERAVFDPFGAVTYFESADTIFRAPWGARTASPVAALPDLATDPRLFISDASGRLRVETYVELADDAAVDQGGQRFYHFENKLYPEKEAASGIPSMRLVWELDARGSWTRITTEHTRFNPFYEPVYDSPDRTARPGTATLRELLIHRDAGNAVGELAPDLAALFPANEMLDPDAPAAAAFPLDESHELIAGLATGDAVHLTEPLVYCATPCTRWEQLTDLASPPNAFDQRAYVSHLPLYLAVRSGVALVEEMVRGDRVAFYIGASAKPILRLESSIGAWGPFRRLWERAQ